MKSVQILLPAAFMLSLSACGGSATSESSTVDVTGETPVVTFTPEKAAEFIGKPSGPVKIGYRLVGKPVVGQPLTVDLQLTTTGGNQPIAVSYRIPDTTALEIPSDQPREISIAAGGDGRTAAHQVTVVPLREGRLYLNVSAEIETPEGRMSSVTAIPLQVGDAPRQLTENGSVRERADGERVRSLPAKQP